MILAMVLTTTQILEAQMLSNECLKKVYKMLLDTRIF